ncbi:universal stress protein [Streptomyces sp. WM6378]|uniref:universal stress protein n=1 Tax=Streptomyces sp. WM6378 TaxID=1415557 RepID=UPI0006ADF7CF|nr:universal stress protein [Streptomyces sp. WM6378]KOU51940.1 universal stress protein UspA [Streptomyces sp. WM6378]
MSVIIWITEGTWPACVDAARERAETADLVLLHVTDDALPEAAHSAFAGLLGRGRPERDPGTRLEDLSRAAADDLFTAAERRLGRPARRLTLHGRAEQQVVRAADGADLLVCARDGDRTYLGPRSLGPATRFVVDHAPCPVLLVWPDAAPGLGTLPPPPHH